MLNRQTKNHDQQNRKLIRIINYLTFLHSQNLLFCLELKFNKQYYY